MRKLILGILNIINDIMENNNNLLSFLVRNGYVGLLGDINIIIDQDNNDQDNNDQDSNDITQ